MLLAVDTSTAQIGAALCDGEKLLAESIWYSHQQHTVELAPAIAELLEHTGIPLDAVEALAVAIGPGSFTALRVGLALIKGLALARKLPVMGVPTLDVLAAAQPATKMPLAAVLQAGRGRIALAWYRSAHPRDRTKNPQRSGWQGNWKSQGAAEVTTVDALVDSIAEPTLIAGELTGEDRRLLRQKETNVVLAPPSACVRRPSVLAEIALMRWRNGQVDDLATLAPIYLQFHDPLHA